MRRTSFIFSVSLIFSITFLVLSCSERGSRFKLSGRLLNLSQATLLAYSEDNGMEHIDTINIEAGRFAYDVECEEPFTIMLVMPNFSQTAIFATPGGKVTIEGDASHLGDMTIKGTKDNELMAAFRKQVAMASPPEKRRLAADFVRNHASSPVSLYLIKHFFINTPEPDYKQAESLLALISDKQDDKKTIESLRKLVREYAKSAVGERLAAFIATDINDNRIDSKQYSTGVSVIYTWASWSYESQNMLRTLNMLNREMGGKLHLLGINLDATKSECQQVMSREHVENRQISDGKLFGTPLFKTLGFGTVPDNMVVVDGRIVARSLNRMQLEEKIRQLLAH